MKKGKMIGRGMTAEVYEWGGDRVLKLFLHGFTEERIKYEAEAGHVVREAGVPSPDVYGTVEMEDRKGIVFGRISGKSMLRHVETEPLMLKHYAKQMARLHFEIHRHSANGLISQKEKLASAIKESSKLLGYREDRIMACLKALPDGDSICHGDLHFDNIIVSGGGPVAIDWANANRGNPLADVARTCITINLPTMPPGTPIFMIMPYIYGKLLTYETYLKEYIRLARVRPEHVDAWMLPVAAAKLKEKIPGEKEWLMDTIDRHLQQYDL